MAIALILFILAIAALAPFFGADSRKLSSAERDHWYPTLPNTRA
ncbi:hypothetical protein ACIB24_16215 [Spongisporangium articulatum]|uniref:Uncharacterized protein n=1 Tax=Spongisporangium articulatum TaxID=3362603 RepID=A0ABW8AQJ9_9ACTN